MKVLLFYVGGLFLTSIFTIGLSAVYLLVASPEVRRTVSKVISKWGE